MGFSSIQARWYEVSDEYDDVPVFRMDGVFPAGSSEVMHALLMALMETGRWGTWGECRLFLEEVEFTTKIGEDGLMYTIVGPEERLSEF